MGKLRVLDLVKPFLPILPEVESPLTRVEYQEKLGWTVAIGICYFLMSELPIYGVTQESSYDPMFWLRPVFASTKGTLLEIGLSPIITSGIVMQVLGGLQYIDVNFDFKSDRELYQSAQKLLAMVLTIFQALAVLFSGLYGSPSSMGTSAIFMFLSQLIVPGFFLIFADETMQKGYSWGTGASFFTVLKVAQEIFWRAFSPSANNTYGKQLIGSVTGLGHLLFTRGYKKAMVEGFFRTHLPNLFETLAAVAGFLACTYFMSYRIDLAVKSTKVRTPAQSYPIRMLYTGAMPLFMIAAISSNLSVFSHSLYAQFPDNMLVRLIGVWNMQGDKLVAVSGLTYYLTPPFSFMQAVLDPIKTIVYAVFLIASCSTFARTWAELSGSSPRDIAKSFKTQGIVIVGHRDVSVVKELKRVIPMAASVGGAALAAMSLTSDVLGAAGLGTASIAAACVMFNYFEILSQEDGLPPDMMPQQG